MTEYIEPTLEEVLAMQLMENDTRLPPMIARYLPYLLLTVQCDIEGKPQQDAAYARFEAFKAKLAERPWMSDGAGI